MLLDILTAMEQNNSAFQRAISGLDAPVGKVFPRGGPVAFESNGDQHVSRDSDQLLEAFPNIMRSNRDLVLYAGASLENPPHEKRVAVLFSGGPASGGHNVVAGLGRVLGPQNCLLGVRNGPKGLLKGDLFEISTADITSILNTGGFDFLGTDRTKIKSDDQLKTVRKVCREKKLNGIVFIGGDDSNTNAAILAEYLFADKVQVIGVPKTIDGDLQAGKRLPISFGYDTATKVYAELVGNVLKDTASSRKYWHFIKLMGRSASHVTLEVALQTKPAVCLISEEVEERNFSIAQIVETIAQTVIKRARKGINHGCVLIPEGLIEFIPEIKELITDLNEALASYGKGMESMTVNEKRDFIVQKISATHAQLFASFPDYIEEMLLLDRDSHGNLQVSQIPTERLLIDMVSARVRKLEKSIKFRTQSHFFGYEGRCGAPSVFDAAYTYNLGMTAGSLILGGRTGYLAAFTDFSSGGRALALPLTGLMNVERRQGKDQFVIEKALVKTESPAFLYFASRRDAWGAEDLFSSPGPIQIWGPMSKQMPITVALNQGYDSLVFDF